MQVVEPGFETTGLICEKETSVGQGEEFGRMTPGSSQKPSNAIVIVCSSDHMMARLSDNTTASVNCMGLRYSCDDTSGQASKGSGSLALGGGGLTNVGAGGQDLLNPEGSPMSEPGDRIFSTPRALTEALMSQRPRKALGHRMVMTVPGSGIIQTGSESLVIRASAPSREAPAWKSMRREGCPGKHWRARRSKRPLINAWKSLGFTILGRNV